MEKKQLLIYVFLIVILILMIFGIKSRRNNMIGNEYVPEVSYKEGIDAETGEKFYRVYDDKTGKILSNTIEESSIQIYKDNPNYKEKIIDKHEEVNYEE